MIQLQKANTTSKQTREDKNFSGEKIFSAISKYVSEYGQLSRLFLKTSFWKLKTYKTWSNRKKGKKLRGLAKSDY